MELGAPLSYERDGGFARCFKEKSKSLRYNNARKWADVDNVFGLALKNRRCNWTWHCCKSYYKMIQIISFRIGKNPIVCVAILVRQYIRYICVCLRWGLRPTQQADTLLGRGIPLWADPRKHSLAPRETLSVHVVRKVQMCSFKSCFYAKTLGTTWILFHKYVCVGRGCSPLWCRTLSFQTRSAPQTCSLKTFVNEEMAE